MLAFQSTPEEKPPVLNILDLTHVPYVDSKGAERHDRRSTILSARPGESAWLQLGRPPRHGGSFTMTKGGHHPLHRRHRRRSRLPDQSHRCVHNSPKPIPFIWGLSPTPKLLLHVEPTSRENRTAENRSAYPIAGRAAAVLAAAPGLTLFSSRPIPLVRKS